MEFFFFFFGLFSSLVLSVPQGALASGAVLWGGGVPVRSHTSTGPASSGYILKHTLP